MKVTIVDRSEKAALRKTRQILCRYLDRISQETYIGNISQDGLLNLRNDLLSSKAITKQASVSAYLHRNGRGPELVWTLGAKARTSADGVYAYKVKSIKARRRDTASPMLDFMSTAVRLAGLFHDLGKGTTGFNRKLKDAANGSLALGAGQDPIRHELVSTLLIDVEDPSAFMKSLGTGPGLASAFEARRLALGSPETKAQILQSLQAALAIANSDGSTGVSDLDFFAKQLSINDSAKWQANPFWMSVLWLVLTHHKLPAGAWNKQRGCFTSLLNRHAGIRSEEGVSHIHNLEALEDFLEMPKRDQPWTHREWARSVNRCIKRLEQLKADHPTFEASMVGADANRATPWLSTLARLGRLSLVMGDYEASCDAVKETCAISPEGKLFANTKQVNDRTQLADFLHVHLQKVGHFAPQILTRLFINQDREFYSPVRLDQFEVPVPLAVPASVVSGLFEWQGHAQQQIARYRHTDRGFFCVVAAGTGRGKTRACAALMSNSRTNPRFSVLLSMRSLTYQTASAYLSDTIGFRSDQVALFVGDDVLKKRFRAEGKTLDQKRQQSYENIGTENLLHDPEQEVFSVLYAGAQRATLSLKSLQSDHFLMRMLSAPVSVMTVDHIMRLVDLSRSKELLALLHLMSADLVLDEIDDYKGDDLICIGRLIELAGQFGRRVIIASATLPKTIIESFRGAYLRGYSTYQAIYGGDDPDSLIVTHHDPYFSRQEEGDYGVFYDQVMGAFVDKEKSAAIANPRRIVTDQSVYLAQIDKKLSAQHQQPMRLIPSDDYEHSSAGSKRTRDDASANFFKAMLMSCIRAHLDNTLIDASTDTKYSVGFARFNTVATAQRFIRELDANEIFTQFSERYCFKFICYHAQNLGVMRTLQEQFLEKHLNRSCMNNGEPDPFASNEHVRAALGEAKSSGRSLITIVLTSSIMETGRDFDFDWCVLEPSSTTSIVQAGGRVRRHRLEPHDRPNVLVMPLSLDAMTDEARAWRALARAGCAPNAAPQTKHKAALVHLNVDPGTSLKRRPSTAPLGLSADLLNVKPLHAGHCLSTPRQYSESSVTVMERVAQLGVLCREFAPEGGDHKTLDYAVSQADILLCNAFYNQTRFRGSEPKTTIEYLRDEQGWFAMGPDGSVRHIGHTISEDFSSSGEDKYLLPNLNVKSLDGLLQLSAGVARALGCRGNDISLAEATLLATSRTGGERPLCYHPQIGFYANT